ncbi:MAG: RluA family pseudouridine synthase [Candidatus Paceibacterota bacterium]|jgi:23S rRNA pseudouridine1911/1915/1917 synthase
MEIKIIYQDKNFVALNKPSGLLVHKAPYIKTNELTLVDWLLENFPQVNKVGDDKEFRPGIVHRLDKETSGIMIAPLNQEYFDYLKSLFQRREIKKTYLAWVSGGFQEKKGTVSASIGIKKGTTKRTVHSSKMSKEAVTDYEVIKEVEKEGVKFSLVKVFPKTGRTHQIRVHLNYINHPVLGDKLYGGKKNSLLAPRLMLHALSLEFYDNNGTKLIFKSDPDRSFLEGLDFVA